MDDIDRPLNDRGKKDAPSMAERMKQMSYHIDHIVSSNARRALDTAAFFHNTFPHATFNKEHQLYHADIDEIFQTCIELEPEVNNVMLVCHNPGITYFANVICGANVDNVPTCGVLVIDVESNDWGSIDMSKFRLVNFLYPKM
jgi:phosphohistidine phosphatase